MIKKIIFGFILSAIISNAYASLECVRGENRFICDVYRMSVPHGWLVLTSNSAEAGITFYPDEKHEWRI